MIRDCLVPVLVMALGVFMLMGTMLSHDISWYLISTRWWLDGVPIYAEIIELNPPLAFYLTAIPVWIAGVLGLSAIAVYKGFVFALIAASLLMSRALLLRSPSMTEPLRAVFLGVAAIGLVLLPIGDFGQRDHLFAIFFLPFLTMSLLEDPPGRSTRAAIAAWAVLGAALKHYFLILPVLILAYKMLAARSLRPALRIEFVLPVLLILLYLGASYVLHPAYFNNIIPLTLQVYGAFDASLTRMMLRASPLIAVLVLATICMILSRRKDHATRLVILVALGAIMVYLVQFKSWYYQRIPANLYVVLALTWAVAGLVHARQHWWPLVPAGLAIGALMVSAVLWGPYTNSFATRAAPYFTCPPGERSFQILSSKVSSGFPLANLAQAEPANRAPALWLFPGAAQLLSQTEDPREQAQYRATLDMARTMALNDFFRAKPQLVIVDDSPDKSYFGAAEFSYLSYFKEVDAFAAAWPAYQHQGRVGHFDIYARDGC